MAKYFSHTCPKCGDYLGVVIPEAVTRETPVDAHCAVCGYRLDWKVIQGSKPAASLVFRVVALLTAFALAFAPAFLRAEICPNSQVSKADLQKFDSAIPIPLLAQVDAEINHLPWGFPGRKKLLYHREFIVSYDTDRRVPAWVAYRLKAEDVVQRPRRNSFRTDPRLTADETATCADYEEPIFDRGHLIPNADLLRSPEAQAYSFFFSNMAPQFASFNRGVWAFFEGLVRDWAKARGTIYIVTGGVFDRNGDGKPDTLNQTEWLPSKRVGVPSHFYKVILAPGATLETISIMLPHLDLNPSDRTGYLRKHIVSIDEIQKRTGLDFLPGLGPVTQEIVEKLVAQDLWPRQ